MKNRIPVILTLVFAALLFLTWAMMFPDKDPQRLWHAFLFNYLFFTSAAGGLVVLPAIVTAAHGEWIDNIEKWCWRALPFAIPSLVALIVLWIGAATWSPWGEEIPGKRLWLNPTFLFSRNLVAQLLFWFMALLFYRNRKKKHHRVYAHWFIVVFVISFSLLGFDFIMALEPKWYSMMMGGYFFISSVYIGIAAWTLLSVISGSASRENRHDLGKMLIAFCMFTTYLMFSQLFPIWYENNPHEILFLIPRMNYSWKWISIALLVFVYIGPIAFLLSSTVKKNPVTLGIIAIVIFLGLWMERWWLVSSVFEQKTILFGWQEAITSLAFLSLSAGIILLSGQAISPEPDTGNQLRTPN